MRTGDRAIDAALERLDSSAAALRNRLDDLTPQERLNVEQVTGEYIPTLIGEYLKMSDSAREAEMSIGGTPREALRKSLELMSALLVQAEKRLNGASATTIAVGKARLEDRIQFMTQVSDTPIVVLDPPDPAPEWPRWVALGAAGAVAVVAVVTGAVWLIGKFLNALSADPGPHSSGLLGGWSALAVGAVVLLAVFFVNPPRDRNRK